MSDIFWGSFSIITYNAHEELQCDRSTKEYLWIDHLWTIQYFEALNENHICSTTQLFKTFVYQTYALYMHGQV